MFSEFKFSNKFKLRGGLSDIGMALTYSYDNIKVNSLVLKQDLLLNLKSCSFNQNIY
jgi:hypothetical protein